MSKPICIKWHIGTDRYGRRVFLTKEDNDFMIEIEPADQRDDGECIRSLSAPLLIEAGKIAADAK